MSIFILPRRIRLLGLAVMSLAGGSGRAAETAPALSLTGEEKAWLTAHPVIRVGYDPDYRPFCFRDAKGNFAGVDADILALVSARLDVRFEFATDRNWTEIYHRAELREVDMLTSTASTPEREERFLFTHDYVKFPVTIITRRDGPFAVTVTDLKAMRVAAVRNYAPTAMLKRDYPELQLRWATSMDDALLLVSRGDADAAVTNLVNASYIIKTRGLANLKIAGVIPQTYATRFAIRNDWPQWQAILDKALASVSPQESMRILDPWIRVDYAAVIRWDVVRRWSIVAALFAVTVIGLVAWRNVGLRRELAKRGVVQQQLETTNLQLNAANDELVARHEEKTHLLHVAAHDLRNPLTGIGLGVGMLRGQLASTPTEAVIEQLGRSVRQMTRLIDDVLDVDALETGRRNLTIEPVDIRAAVAEAVESHRSAAVHKEIVLACDAAVSVPSAAADASGLRQVLDNLLSNAVKFSPRGSRIDVAVTTERDHVRVEIRDRGPGVPRSEQERIFTKFVRGTARPTDGEKSTGLGLAIVRELTSAMNGRVWCEPAPGGGTIFAVLLPVHRPVAAAKA
jgi:two-component system sensor histidine kinase EvgS